MSNIKVVCRIRPSGQPADAAESILRKNGPGMISVYYPSSGELGYMSATASSLNLVGADLPNDDDTSSTSGSSNGGNSSSSNKTSCRMSFGVVAAAEVAAPKSSKNRMSLCGGTALSSLASPPTKSVRRRSNFIIPPSPSALKCTAPTSTTVTEEQTFTFDSVFDGDSSQTAIFDAVGLPVIKEIMDGYNCTVFAYGQTGSGKTHTMMGKIFNATDDSSSRVCSDQEGIIPRLHKELFSLTEKHQNVTFVVKMSMIEIYLEKIRDLLDICKDNLKVREGRGSVWVDELTQIPVGSAQAALSLLEYGNANRSIGCTNMNEKSSRSHSCVIVQVDQMNKLTGERKSAKLTLVDLAGSEKVAKSGAEGHTLKEAQHINKSLSALGNVINGLSSGQGHIPYRDSKLTRLLTDSLGGNSKTCLIVTCSPSQLHLDETIGTLRFGKRAKNIKNKPVQNRESEKDYKKMWLASQQALDDSTRMIALLKEQIAGMSQEQIVAAMKTIATANGEKIVGEKKEKEKEEKKEEEGKTANVKMGSDVKPANEDTDTDMLDQDMTHEETERASVPHVNAAMQRSHVDDSVAASASVILPSMSVPLSPSLFPLTIPVYEALHDDDDAAEDAVVYGADVVPATPYIDSLAVPTVEIPRSLSLSVRVASSASSASPPSSLTAPTTPHDFYAFSPPPPPTPWEHTGALFSPPPPPPPPMHTHAQTHTRRTGLRVRATPALSPSIKESPTAGRGGHRAGVEARAGAGEGGITDLRPPAFVVLEPPLTRLAPRGSVDGVQAQAFRSSGKKRRRDDIIFVDEEEATSQQVPIVQRRRKVRKVNDGDIFKELGERLVSKATPTVPSAGVVTASVAKEEEQEADMNMTESYSFFRFSASSSSSSLSSLSSLSSSFSSSLLDDTAATMTQTSLASSSLSSPLSTPLPLPLVTTSTAKAGATDKENKPVESSIGVFSPGKQYALKKSSSSKGGSKSQTVSGCHDSATKVYSLRRSKTKYTPSHPADEMMSPLKKNIFATVAKKLGLLENTQQMLQIHDLVKLCCK